MDREQRTIKAIAEAIARGECPPRTTPREWTHFEKQAKAVFYDLVLTVQLHDDDDESPAKVGGDEREAFEAWCKQEFPGLEVRAQNLLGTYTKSLTEWLYTGWQARAALSADGGENIRKGKNGRWPRHIERAKRDAERWRTLEYFGWSLDRCECDVEPFVMWAVVGKSAPALGWFATANAAIDAARAAIAAKAKGEA